jgi:murein DD-endopeptidase MepM/ murein hydrolase activator NlpD
MSLWLAATLLSSALSRPWETAGSSGDGAPVGVASSFDLRPAGLDAAAGDGPPEASSVANGPEGPITAAPAGPSGGPGPLVPLSYTVQPGDSLADIAARFGVDVPTLIASNDLDDPDLLPTGWQLKVLPVPGVLYRVAEGDTLNRIAARYDVAVRDILRANDLESSELIAAGQELVLPGARPVVAHIGPADTASASAEAGAAVNEAPAASAGRPTQQLASLPVSRPGFAWPARGPITTYFGEVGWTSPRGHAGIDISAPWGAPVVAAASGQVLLATRAGGGYGIEIILDHGGGLRTVYGHLSELDVQAGEGVSRSQLIGLVGSTGFSTGPHLHFEVRQNGELRNPLNLLP